MFWGYAKSEKEWQYITESRSSPCIRVEQWHFKHINVVSIERGTSISFFRASTATKRQIQAILYPGAQGATQQNIQDLGNFFVACKGEEAKFSVKFPIGSTTDIASSFDGGPSWLASYVNQVLQTNTVESLLALLYCAVGLHLPHLEQICLVGLAAKFKGKNMEEMQRMLS